MLLKNLLDKKIFNKHLFVKGYSNLNIDKEKKEFLIRVALEDRENNELYKTDYLQPELITLFPLKSEIYKGKIEKLEGNLKEIEINFNQVQYKKLKDIENIELVKLIENEFFFHKETYFAKYKNIIFPSLVIGQYFYFPNTNVRRLFRKEHIEALAYEVYCDRGHILFKNNVKNEQITAIFAYLFECNKQISKAFNESFNININYSLKEKLELYSPTIFKFPKIDKALKLLVRGEMFNNVFIVYEILNFDFRQIIPLDKLEVSYLGKKQIKSLKTNKIASKVSINKSNISQTASYSKEYTETIFESSEFIINDLNQIKVEKVNPVKFNETFSKKEVYKKNEDNQGITFGNNQDNNSGFGSAGLAIDKSSFKLLEGFINKTFNVSFYESGNKPDYAYIHFVLVFRDGSHREYLIVKLNRPNTAWYIFSSFNKLPRIFSIIDELLRIKDGKSRFKNNNYYAAYLLKGLGVCFHRSLKAKEKTGNINHWFQRFKERILDYGDCKGMK